jgi:DNA-binding XRE family transcriptional regulator
MAVKPTTRRRGTPPNPALAQPDYPYTMKLADGRRVLVEVPGRWVAHDRDGAPAFLPEGVAFLDRVRAAYTAVRNTPPSPGFLTALREGLGLTQAEFGAEVGVFKLTVSRWERGTLRPSRRSLEAIERVRKAALRRGVAVPG